jgi:WD40 repeat protein
MVAIKSKLLLVVLLFGLTLGGAGWAGYGLLLGSGQAEERAETQEKLIKTRQTKQVPNLVDQYGDPLPEGALARLGTQRFRHVHSMGDLPTAFSPHSKTVVTVGDGIMRRWDTSTGKLIGRFPGDRHVIVLYAPNGKWIAEHGQLLDPISGKVVQHLPEGATPLAFSRDGAILVIGEQDGSLTLWDTALGKPRTKLGGSKENVDSAAFSADNRTLITLRGFIKDLEARHWSLAKGTLIRSIKLPERGHTLRLSPDGKIMATCNRQDVSLWDTTTGEQCGTLTVEGMTPQYGLAFSQDSRTLATDWYDRQTGEARFCIWDVANRELLRRFPARAPGFLFFSPDDRILASSDHGPCLRLWDVTTGRPLQQYPAHDGAIWAIAFTPDGRVVLSGSNDGTLRVWDAGTGKHVRELPGHPRGVTALAATPDGLAVVSGGHGAELILQEWQTGKELRRLVLVPKEQLSPNVSYGSHLTLAQEGRTVVASIGTTDGGSLLHVWDLTDGRVRQRRADHSDSYIFSADARMLATFVSAYKPASSPKQVKVRETAGTQAVVQDVITGRTRLSILLPDSYGHRAAFSPDGRTLMTSSYKLRTDEKGSRFSDHTLHLWELVTGFERLTVRSPDEGRLADYSTFTFSPDGRILAAARYDETIRLFDLATGAEALTLSGHEADVYTLAFRPDGKALASGHRDSTILMWDLVKLAGKLSTPLPLTEVEVARAWADLASVDARKAYAAILELAATPNRAVPYLRARLVPATAPPAETLRKLLADLDSERFQLRQAAFKELSDIGETADLALEEALKTNPSLEKRRRIEQLLAAPHIVRDSNLLRAVRSLEVLERIASAPARDVLKAIADGAPEARLTREARATLQRLSGGK